MYNLLITGNTGVWEEQGYEIPRERFGEYTESSIKESFQEFNEETLQKLQSLPTLFGYEGDNDNYRVGYLSRIKVRQKMLYIQYIFDSRIPKIPFAVIRALKTILDIQANEQNYGEFSRTHWAVKDEDLFKILYESEIIDSAIYTAIKTTRLPTANNSTNLEQYEHLVKHDDFRRSGDVLNGEYRLEGFIGSGGIGMVYLATDLLSNKESEVVAVKIIKPDVLTRNPDQIRLFENEFRTASKLDHPNIVKIFKSGTDEKLRCTYLAMEIIDGVALDDFLLNNRLTTNEITDIFRQICAAVYYSHLQNVLHLDIKPANILLLKNGNSFDVKVIDFGMAKIIASDSGTTVTRFGGTPQFCSPEHFIGRKQTKLSDVYSLGATLHNLLTGVTPFGAASYFNAKQYSHLEMPPTPSVLPYRPDVPTEIDIVIEKAISKNPAARQQSAEELFQDFQNALAGKKVSVDFSVSDPPPSFLPFQQADVDLSNLTAIENSRHPENLETFEKLQTTMAVEELISSDLTEYTLLKICAAILLIGFFWYTVIEVIPKGNEKTVNELGKSNVSNTPTNQSVVSDTNSSMNGTSATVLNSNQFVQGDGLCGFPPEPVFNPFKIVYEGDSTTCSNPPLIDVAKDAKETFFAKSMESYYSIRKFKENDVIVVRLFIINGANPLNNSQLTTIHNVKITTAIEKIKDSRYKLSAKFTGDKVAPISGSVTVETEKGNELKLIPNTGYFFNLEMKRVLDLQEFNFGDSVFNLGKLDAGFEYSLFYSYKLKFVSNKTNNNEN